MARRPARKTKLTELFVRKLKPEVRAYLVWDTHQRGLAIRTQPSGSKAWMCVYSYRGRPRWYHLGDANAIGLAAARKLTAEVMLDVIRGKDPAAEKRAERGAGTFAELAERYVEQYAKRHNKSWSQPDRLVRRYLLPKWGKLQAIFLRSSVRDASIVAKGTSACGFRTVRVGSAERRGEPSHGSGVHRPAGYRFAQGHSGDRTVHWPSLPQRSQPKCPRLRCQAERASSLTSLWSG